VSEVSVHETESINYEDGEPAIGEVKTTTSKKLIVIFSIAAIVAIGVLTLTSSVASAGVINMPNEYTMIRDASANAQVAHAPSGPWSFDGTLVAPFSDQWKANFQIDDFMANFRSMRTARKPAMSKALWQQEQPQTSGASRAVLGSWGDTYHVPGDYPTIQKAIDNATGGETILVEPGRYNETVDVTVSHIVLKANSTNPADTVVSANGTDDHVINITNQTNVTVVGFTIQDARGTSQDVAGIYMNTTSNCTITNNVIMNISTAGGYDAYGLLVETAINFASTDATVRDIHGNNNSIGILIEEGMNIDFDPTLTENVTASNGAAFGFLIEAINLSLTDTAVHNITGNSFAYGILLFTENAGFNHTVIERVNASSAAYGIYAGDIINGSFTDTTIHDITGGSLALGLYTMHAENVSFDHTVIEQVIATTVCGIFAVDVIWTENRLTDNTTITDGNFADTTIRDIGPGDQAYGIWLVAENVSFIHTVIERVSATRAGYGSAYGIEAGIQNISFTDTRVHNITGDSGAIGIGGSAENVSFNHTVIEQVKASPPFLLSNLAYGILMVNITDGRFSDTTISNITGNYGFFGIPGPAGMYILTYAKNVSFNHTVIERINAPNGLAVCMGFDSIQNGSFADTTISDITGNSFACGFYMVVAENVSFDSTIIERINAPNGLAFGIFVYGISYPPYLQNGSFADTTISDIAGEQAFGISLAAENGSFTDTTIHDITGNSFAYGIWLVAVNVSFGPTVIERVNASNGNAYGIYGGFANGSFTDTTFRDITGNEGAFGISGVVINTNFSGGEITNCGHGIWLEGKDNRIEGFIIRDNTLLDTGVHLETMMINTTICRNCFYNNVLQAWDNGTNNSWIGNYWSDWNGTEPYPINGSAGSEDSSPLDVCPLKVELLPNITAPKVAIDVNGLTLLPGEVICYTVWINNTGNGSSADNPGNEFEDSIPSNTTYINGSATASSGTIKYNESNSIIIWNGDIPTNGSIKLTFCVTVDLDVPPGTSISNQGTVNYDSDGDRFNDVQMLTDDPATALLEDATKLITASPLPPQVQVPAVTPVGLIALASLLSAIAAVAIVRKRR
jgi:uncharacterized repeat protein (TIGR01451 family)